MKVAIYEREAWPKLLVAVWHLGDGLQIFTDGTIADLDSMLRVVEAISVRPTPTGPTVSYDEPLSRADSDPDLYMRDSVTFRSSDDSAGRTDESSVSLEVLDIADSAIRGSGETEEHGYFIAWRRLPEGLLLRLTGHPAQGSKVARSADFISQSVEASKRGVGK